MLRARRICSKAENLEQRLGEMKQAILGRGYHPDTISRAAERVKAMPRASTLQYKKKEKSTRVPFIITHNPANPPLRQWLHEQQDILHRSERMKGAVPEVPVVGERNSRNFRAWLMPSTLPPIIVNTQPGAYKCGERQCVTCQQHLVETTTFSSDNTGEVFTIRHHLTCTTNNLLYLLFCCKCKGWQYVGETGMRLKDRFYGHRHAIKNTSATRRTYVMDHFQQPDHSLGDMRCFPFEKVYSPEESIRLKRE